MSADHVSIPRTATRVAPSFAGLATFAFVAELFDAVEDELEPSLELAGVVVARRPELLDHFDEVWEPAGEGWVR